MQEAAAAHIAFARILAIGQAVDARQIALAVARYVARRGELARIGARDLQPVGRRRMRGEEVEEARVDAAVGALAQFGIAAHRGEEAHRAIGIESGARRDADADAVGLELLRAREGGERDLRPGERQRAHLRIVEHVGGDAAHQRGLAHLVLADRGMARHHMRHLVGEHRGELGGVAGEREQAARHVELAGRQREGVDRRRVEDGRLVLQVRPLRGRDQAVHRLRQQRLEPRVLIGAAIGGENAIVLALRRLRDLGGLRRLGQADLRRAQAADIGAAGEQQREQRRRHPACRKPGRSVAAHSQLPPSVAWPFLHHLDLLGTRRLHPGAAPLLDPPANPHAPSRRAISARGPRRRTRAHCAWRW